MAEEGILKIAFYLSKNNIDLREMFQGILYDETIEDKEFELIPIRDFADVVKNLMSLEDKHV